MSFNEKLTALNFKVSLAALMSQLFFEIQGNSILCVITEATGISCRCITTPSAPNNVKGPTLCDSLSCESHHPCQTDGEDEILSAIEQSQCLHCLLSHVHVLPRQLVIHPGLVLLIVKKLQKNIVAIGKC